MQCKSSCCFLWDVSLSLSLTTLKTCAHARAGPPLRRRMTSFLQALPQVMCLAPRMFQIREAGANTNRCHPGGSITRYLQSPSRCTQTRLLPQHATYLHILTTLLLPKNSLQTTTDTRNHSGTNFHLNQLNHNVRLRRVSQCPPRSLQLRWI